MKWTTKVPRHLNRYVLATAISRYAIKITKNFMLTIGPLVGSIAILFILFPLTVLLLVGLEGATFVPKIIIRLRHPRDILVSNVYDDNCSSDEFGTNHVAMLKTVKGILNREDVIKHLHYQFEEKKSKILNKTTLQSPFKCIISSRYGIPVWTPDENFDYRNHVITVGNYNAKSITIKNLKITVSDLCRSLPNKGKSPWEVFVLHVQSPLSRKPDSTALLVRTHSCLAINSIMSAINIFDMPFSSVKLSVINPVQSFCRPVFSKDSITINVIRGSLKSTIAAIDCYRSKCDPNVLNIDINDDPLWLSVRGAVKTARKFNDRLQKLNDSYAELGTPTMRVLWSKSTALVQVAPRILSSILDWLWEISIPTLARNLCIQLPQRTLRILHNVVQKLTRKLPSIVSELKYCKTRKTLVINCIREFNFTFKAIILAPYFIFMRCISQRGKTHGAQSILVYPTLSWSEPLSMNMVRQVANLTDSSAFEVLTTAVSSALIKYVTYYTAASQGPLNLIIPIYNQLRYDESNNATEGYLVLKIPTSAIHNKQEHLRNVKSQMTGSDAEFRYFLSMMFHRYLVPHIPKFIHSCFSKISTDQFTFYLYNTVVPYLNNYVAINNNVVDSMRFWNAKTVPSMNLMISHDHAILVVSGNSNNLVHPDKITNQFIIEFQSLAWIANNNAIKKVVYTTKIN